jgi:hypothetical protein
VRKREEVQEVLRRPGAKLILRSTSPRGVPCSNRTWDFGAYLLGECGELCASRQMLQAFRDQRARLVQVAAQPRRLRLEEVRLRPGEHGVPREPLRPVGVKMLKQQGVPAGEIAGPPSLRIVPVQK